MKVFLYLICFILFGSILYLSFPFQEKPERLFQTHFRSDQSPNPEDWMFRQRAFPYGHIRKDIYHRAMEQWQALSAARSSQDQVWNALGPTNIGGRITSLAVAPNDVQTIYIGAASGGVFKSTDGGQSWLPIFDKEISLSIGDLAIAPSQPQTVYVGTGEANAGGGSLAYDGAGVYKSTNGGLTWINIGLENTGSTGKVIIHPQEANRVYAATMGSLFANNPDRGLYRTTDGGDNWEQILFINDSTGLIDLAMHPFNPDILFAASWERIRRPNRRQYGGRGSDIYRSTDGGDYWEKLSLPISPDQPLGRIGLASSPVQADRVFASVVDAETNRLLGVYLSDDLGNNWTKLPLQGISQVPFMWWFGKIYADPIDADRVYICGLELYQLDIGNNAWQSIMDGVHVDQHALYLEPQERSFLLLGNDGGLYRGTGNFKSSWTHINNLPITQFYTAEIDYTHPERLFGGTQDNGTIRSNQTSGFWQRILGGDGFVVLVDPNNSQQVYAESQYGNFRRSTTGGDSFSNGTPTQSIAEAKNWNTPILLDPVQPSTLYYGAQRIYRSTDQAITWQAISPILVEAPEGSNLAFGTLTTLAVSPADTRIIYAGADDGSIFLTVNGGIDWELISENLPNRWVTRLSAHPSDPDIVYVSFSGYRWDEYLPHVLRSDNKGQHWNDISGGLPEVPVNDLVINPDQPEQLFLATDAGVFISNDEGQFWDILGQELPKVVVNDLAYHSPSHTLVAGTYGRSMYQLKLEDDPVSRVAEPAISIKIKAFPNPFREHTQIQLELETASMLEANIYDLNGRLVQKLHRGKLGPGQYNFDFRAPAATSYICNIQTGRGSKNLLLTTL